MREGFVKVRPCTSPGTSNSCVIMNQMLADISSRLILEPVKPRDLLPETIDGKSMRSKKTQKLHKHNSWSLVKSFNRHRLEHLIGIDTVKGRESSLVED